MGSMRREWEMERALKHFPIGSIITSWDVLRVIYKPNEWTSRQITYYMRNSPRVRRDRYCTKARLTMYEVIA